MLKTAALAFALITATTIPLHAQTRQTPTLVRALVDNVAYSYACAPLPGFEREPNNADATFLRISARYLGANNANDMLQEVHRRVAASDLPTVVARSKEENPNLTLDDQKRACRELLFETRLTIQMAERDATL